MRDYDKLRSERDLEFKVGGSVFVIRPMPLKQIGIWTDREKEVDTSDTPAFTQMCIDRIADAIADGNGSEQRWRDLCESDAGPTYGELLELARWVWEVQSDLPTTGSEPSEPGPTPTAVSSRGA